MPDTVGGCSHDRPMTGRGQFSVTRHTADGRSVPRGDKEAWTPLPWRALKRSRTHSEASGLSSAAVRPELHVREDPRV